MKLRTIALATVLTAVSTAPVLAGASVTNTNTVRHGKVRSTLNVDSYKHVSGSQYNFSEALKMESNGPGFAYANVNFNSYFGLSGSAYADNVPNNPDPVAIGAYSSQVEIVNFTETTFVNLEEIFHGYETTTTHTVETDTF